MGVREGHAGTPLLTVETARQRALARVQSSAAGYQGGHSSNKEAQLWVARETGESADQKGQDLAPI